MDLEILQPQSILSSYWKYISISTLLETVCVEEVEGILKEARSHEKIEQGSSIIDQVKLRLHCSADETV